MCGKNEYYVWQKENILHGASEVYKSIHKLYGQNYTICSPTVTGCWLAILPMMVLNKLTGDHFGHGRISFYVKIACIRTFRGSEKSEVLNVGCRSVGPLCLIDGSLKGATVQMLWVARIREMPEVRHDSKSSLLRR